MYQNAKIYSDGEHYIAIPKENFPHGKKKNSSSGKRTPHPVKAQFETAYKQSLSKPKKERKKEIKEALKNEFANKDELTEFIDMNMERVTVNAIKRKVRLMRKLRLQDWNYFCTFTYDDKLHTEETFRKKLSNTLKHLVYRNGWKYVGVWERSPEKQRLHFHGIFYIPKMVGELTEVRDYDTKHGKMQTTHINSHFLKHFGRNDFRKISEDDDLSYAARYITKYMEKTGEKLVYGGKLPTYFLSDILDEDVVCSYGVEGKKAILFDNFTCINDGEIIGQVSKETIAQLPKCN